MVCIIIYIYATENTVQHSRQSEENFYMYTQLKGKSKSTVIMYNKHQKQGKVQQLNRKKVGEAIEEKKNDS